MSRIVIADPHPFMLAALNRRLVDAGHEVVGEASDGREALELVKRLHPDLLLFELDLPRLGGLELLRRLHRDWPQQKTLVFTHLPAAHYQGMCLEAGARGFVHKSDRPEELDDAVRLVLGGRSVFPAQAPHAASEAAGSDEHITPRELTVLQYLSQGFRVKDIAEELAISDRTVSTYKARLLEKTQTDSLVDLVQAAKVKGLLNNSVMEGLAQKPTAPASKSEDLARLLDILPNPVSLWSREGKLLACNPEFLALHEGSEEELLGSPIFKLGLVAEEDVAQARRVFLSGAAGNEPFTLITNATVRGEQRIVRLIAVPLQEDNGHPIGVLVSFVDITEHERDVERLQQENAYLDSLRTSRSRYLEQGFNDLLKEARQLQSLLPETSQRTPTLVDIAKGVDRIEENLVILRELLRTESNSEPTVPQVYELNQLTASLLTHVALQPTETPHFAWIDPARYRNMLKALQFSLERSALKLREAQASVENLPHGELIWRLQFMLLPQDNLAERLADFVQRPSMQLVRMICELFNGQFQPGRADEPASAGLIQLKLVRSSSPH
ncbi:response regulator [Pseudomonas sp. NY15437]|uniref:response regulator n=1 Tax=Pseudomonas sp. NY15437 TaxID=3400360 RepID=UPI003A8687BD